MKKIVFIVAFMIGSLSFAQNFQFKNETIQKFAEAYKEVRNENMTLQLNMLTAIEDAGLTSDEFTKIHSLLKNPDTANQPSATEKSKYNIALKNIEKLNESIQESIERIISDNGLKVETYHAIAKASQSDAGLKQKIQKYIR